MRVGLCVERSLELVVGLLGILKAGGAYVPLDPSYPAERLAFMLEDARRRRCCSTQAQLAAAAAAAAQVVLLDASRSAARAPTRRRRAATPTTWPTCIYTSGSTGRPKGVAHRRTAGAGRLIRWTHERCPSAELARRAVLDVAQLRSVGVRAVRRRCSTGGACVDAAVDDALALLERWRRRRDATLVNTVPSAAAARCCDVRRPGAAVGAALV